MKYSVFKQGIYVYVNCNPGQSLGPEQLREHYYKSKYAASLPLPGQIVAFPGQREGRLMWSLSLPLHPPF